MVMKKYDSCNSCTHTHGNLCQFIKSGCQDSIRFGIFQAEEWKKSRINWEWGDFNLLPVFWKMF